MAMVHNRPKRSRKVVTYGKSSRSRAKDLENITSEPYAPVTASGPASDPKEDLQQCNRPEGVISRNYALDSAKHISAPSDDTQGIRSSTNSASVCDWFPSSDEGHDHPVIRKKRKNLTSSGHRLQSHRPHHLSTSGHRAGHRAISASGFPSSGVGDAAPSLQSFPVNTDELPGVEVVIRTSPEPERPRSSQQLSTHKSLGRRGTNRIKTTTSSLMQSYHRLPAVAVREKNVTAFESSQRPVERLASRHGDYLSSDHLSVPGEDRPTQSLRQRESIDDHWVLQPRRVNPANTDPLCSSTDTAPSNNDWTSDMTVGGRSNSPGRIAPNRKRIVDSLGAHKGSMKGLSMNSGSDDRSRIPSLDHSDMSSDDSFVRASQTHNLSGGEVCHTEEQRASIPLASSQTGGSKVTYARQRSFLNDLCNPGGVEHQEVPVDLQESIPRRQPQHPNGSVAAVSLLIDDEDSNRSSSVRSIHELRQAGGNARFQGMVNSMFEDIENESNSVSSRRSGFIQLCGNLTDRQFCLRFLESGFDRRLSGCLTDQLDVISSYLALCAYGLIIAIGSPPLAVLLSFWPKVLRLAAELLQLQDDILVLARQRRFNMSKAGQAAIRDLSSHLHSMFSVDQLPSWLYPQLLALSCIQLTLRKCRERGDPIERIPDTLLAKIVELLVRYSPHSGDHSLSSKNLLVLEQTLSILQTYTILPASLGNDHENPIKPLCRLGHLLSSLDRCNDSRAKEVQVLYIRLVLNITNNNTSLCEDFSTPEFVRSLAEIVLKDFERVSEDFAVERKESLDTVILALGTLINLTEESATSRKLILGEMTQSGSLFDRLLLLFSTGFDAVSEADSVVQTHSNVAFGYLSILLCTLSLDGKARSHLKNSLSGNGLAQVLATVDEFLHYHRKVEEELQGFEAKQDPMAEFTSRLQGIVNRIRQSEKEDSA